jgi:two-component system response regulator YesN
MNLLIVDDELDTAAYLAQLFENHPCGITAVRTAYSGKEAVQMILEVCPDIILCDIEMPQMDGLELLEWIRQAGIKSEFIFLTCHENFDYAARAIHLHVNNYLTKPVNEKSVVNAVASCIEKIRSEQYLEQYSTYGKAWLKSSSIIYQNFWRRILFHTRKDEMERLEQEAMNAHMEIDFNENWSMVVTGINESEILDEMWNDQIFYFAFRQFAVEIFTGDPQYVHFTENRENSFIYYHFFFSEKKADHKHLMECCREFVEKCEEVLSYHTNCWLSQPVSIDALPEERKWIMAHYVGNQKGPESVFDETYVSSEDRKVIDETVMRLLAEKFSEKDRMGVISLMTDVLTGLSERHQMDKKNLMIVSQSYMQVLFTWLKDHEVVAEQLFTDETAQILFQNSVNTVFDLVKWIDFSVERALDYVAISERADPLIRKTKQYIREHYNENIRRSELASLVYLTPNYLSSLFHERTGMSITDYITECRLSEAKKRLLGTTQSVSEIAVDCGFNNISYFSTVFKKEEGITPVEYRNQEHG